MNKEEIEKLFDNEIEHSFRIGTNGLDEYVTESAKRCADVAFTLIEQAKRDAAIGFQNYVDERIMNPTDSNLNAINKKAIRNCINNLNEILYNIENKTNAPEENKFQKLFNKVFELTDKSLLFDEMTEIINICREIDRPEGSKEMTAEEFFIRNKYAYLKNENPILDFEVNGLANLLNEFASLQVLKHLEAVKNNCNKWLGFYSTEEHDEIAVKFWNSGIETIEKSINQYIETLKQK